MKPQCSHRNCGSCRPCNRPFFSTQLVGLEKRQRPIQLGTSGLGGADGPAWKQRLTPSEFQLRLSFKVIFKASSIIGYRHEAWTQAFLLSMQVDTPAFVSGAFQTKLSHCLSILHRAMETTLLTPAQIKNLEPRQLCLSNNFPTTLKRPIQSNSVKR